MLEYIVVKKLKISIARISYPESIEQKGDTTVSFGFSVHNTDRFFSVVVSLLLINLTFRFNKNG